MGRGGRFGHGLVVMLALTACEDGGRACPAYQALDGIYLDDRSIG